MFKEGFLYISTQKRENWRMQYYKNCRCLSKTAANLEFSEDVVRFSEFLQNSIWNMTCA